QDLTELAVALHERADAVAIQLQILAVAAGTSEHERAASRQQVNVAAELTWLVHGDESLAGVARAHDLQRATEHHVQMGRLVALIEQHLACLYASARAERGHALDLIRGEGGENVAHGFTLISRQADSDRNQGVSPCKARSSASTCDTPTTCRPG